ncbi:MAG: molybdate transporter subunit [Pseudomonadota bacterium]
MRLSAMICVALAIALSPVSPVAAASGETITVFAASSLSNALEDVAKAFTSRGGGKVRFSFAASSTLAKQIESGAEAHFFLSADTRWMDYLAARALIAQPTRRPLLKNRLVLVVPNQSPSPQPINTTSPELPTDRTWLDRLPRGRIAIADPAHVPAGRYAEEALTALGLWVDVRPRLARAENVRSALVLVERGEAAAGIVYATDAIASKHVTIVGAFRETTHAPIVYPMARLKGREPAAALAFYDFLLSAEARAIFARYGFLSP